MRKLLDKIFGGLNISWKNLILFSVLMGVWTALMALFVPDGNSLHDIAATPEWWVLPAILIIVNSKKPLEAALKTFVFFLISQPLVYLVQVPFSELGWGLFSYYPYWFKLTVLTFPGAYLGWFVKKDKWYSGLILSVMTALLVETGYGYAKNLGSAFPNHLLSIIYCFAIIPIFIMGIFKNKAPRIITAVVSVATLIALMIIIGGAEMFETYSNSFLGEYEIELGNDSFISSWSGSAQGNAEMIKYEGEEGKQSFNFKLTGYKGNKYYFTITDGENEYHFVYYFDENSKAVVVNQN